MILLLYDNRLRLLILGGNYVEPFGYLVSLIVTTWLFNITGKRPGIVLQEKSHHELQTMRAEVNDYWKSEGENDPLESGAFQSDGPEFGDSEKSKSEGTTFGNSTEKIESGVFEDEEINGSKQNLKNKKDPIFEEDDEETDNNKDREESNKFEPPPLHFCNKCNIVQEYRTRHCKSCDTCIAKFDHHCFWIGNLWSLGGCVGELNHRKFWLMLLAMTIEFSWSACYVTIAYRRSGLAWTTIKKAMRQITKSKESNTPRNMGLSLWQVSSRFLLHLWW